MNLELNNTDCLVGMKDLPSKSVDLIFTDPPYNVSSSTKITRDGGKFGHAKDINLNFGEWDYGSVMPEQYIDEFVRLLKDCGVLVMFYNKLYLGAVGQYLEETYGFQVRHIGSWIKSNPVPQARKVKWQNGVENFLIATKNKGSGHHFNYRLGQSPDYYVHSVSYKHEHPTQKPLPLAEWIVSYWSFEGDTVFDPFCGSGVFLVAAKKLNRNYVGYELDKKYYDLAVINLKRTLSLSQR